jgi:hypothetical protein
MPWVGVVAAVIAALTIVPYRVFLSPRKAFAPAVQVTGVWLLVALLLTSVARFGGGGSGGEGKAEGTETGQNPSALAESRPAGIGKAGFPAGIPKSVDVLLSFIAAEGDSTEARQFACDLLIRGEGDEAARIEIRAGSMEEFLSQLEGRLGDANSGKGRTLSSVLILRNPFPGEGVLSQVRDLVQSVLPNASVHYDKEQEP